MTNSTRCPKCSFNPTSLSDYCDEHRPQVHRPKTGEEAVYSEREAAANVALDGGDGETRPEIDAATAFHQMFERWLEEDANPAGLMKVRELCHTAFITGLGDAKYQIGRNHEGD